MAEKDLSKEWLFTRPKGVSYTAMCIWIDSHIYEPDCDIETAYKYLWLIANMLTCKKKYFGNRWQDYNDFSSYLANDVYFRLMDPKKKKIKSVLNYMKSIIYFRKNRYCKETFSEVVDLSKSQYSDFNEDLFRDINKSNLESYNHKNLELQVEDLMADIPNIVRSNISDVYKYNNRLYENIYISSLLTIINRFTLPNAKLEYIDNKLKESRLDLILYFCKNKDTDPVYWHLPQELKSVVSVVVNRSYGQIIKGINEAIDRNKVGDDEYISILATGFFGDEPND